MTKYRLLHKKIGVKKIETICEFESKEKIKDICFFNKNGFFLLGDKSLFSYDNSNNILNTIATFKNPNSMCCSRLGSIYVVCEDGIKIVNPLDNFYISSLLTKHDYESLFCNLAKIGFFGITISEIDGNIALAISPLNKCFVYGSSSIKREIGGKQGYCVANNIDHSYLYNPRGILLYDESTVIVSDTGNGCIRSFGTKHKIITGNPGSNTLAPTKIEIDRKKDVLYFLSNNYLKLKNLSSGHEAELYEGNNLVSIVLWKESKILVLEEIK